MSEEPGNKVATPPAEQGPRWTIPWALVAGAPTTEGPLPDWHGHDGHLNVAGYRIDAPMVYTASGAGATAEASCIDLDLPVEGEAGASVPPFGHWPHYGRLTPRQRGAYLRWLAAGKAGPVDDINCVFLYFYGLERRALLEQGDPERIIKEVLRLLKHYDRDPSFFACASRFVAYLFAIKGIRKLKPSWFTRLFVKRSEPLHSDALSVALTWLQARGEALPGALAFDVVQRDLRALRGPAYTADPEAFRGRFLQAYAEAHGEGLLLETAQMASTWTYRPINPSLQHWACLATLRTVTTPDVLGAREQFGPLITLWRRCLVEATGGGEGSGGAQPLESWATLVDQYASTDGRIVVPLRVLAKVVGQRPAKVTADLAGSEGFAAAIRDGGFEVLPHPRSILRPYRKDELLVLSWPASGPVHASERYFLAGALLLQLGTAMAQADGVVEELELLHISEIVNALYHFNEYDKQRLSAFRVLFSKRPPRLAPLGRRVRAILNRAELEHVGAYLVGVAASNHRIDASEKKALRRAYRAFGIPVATLEQRMDALCVSGGDGVNEAELGRIMGETAAFAVDLGQAMAAVVATSPEHAGAKDQWFTRAPVAASQPVGRDRSYEDALYGLLRRPGWSEAEALALGVEHGRLPAALGAPLARWAESYEDDHHDGATRYGLALGEEEE